MRLLRLFKYFLFCLVLHTPLYSKNIGLLVVATGKYVSFIPPLIQSADQFFCKEHRVTFFIFTDSALQSADHIVPIYQERLGWPYDTMMRYHIYHHNRAYFEEQDYLFACDADMLFAGEVGNEILGERVATIHPGFVNQRGSYETNPMSLACVYPNEGKYYYAGGFYGGSKEEMMNIAKTNAQKIDQDLQNGMIAVWHDESHWNRYCIDHPPTVILSPSYCYPESWHLPYEKKILALDKNHSEFRE